jgi:hypothetical protein
MSRPNRTDNFESALRTCQNQIIQIKFSDNLHVTGMVINVFADHLALKVENDPFFDVVYVNSNRIAYFGIPKGKPK